MGWLTRNQENKGKNSQRAGVCVVTEFSSAEHTEGQGWDGLLPEPRAQLCHCLLGQLLSDGSASLCFCFYIRELETLITSIPTAGFRRPRQGGNEFEHVTHMYLSIMMHVSDVNTHCTHSLPSALSQPLTVLPQLFQNLMDFQNRFQLNTTASLNVTYLILTHLLSIHIYKHIFTYMYACICT